MGASIIIIIVSQPIRHSWRQDPKRVATIVHCSRNSSGIHERRDKRVATRTSTGSSASENVSGWN
eukprot:COSAG04_NODE_881_length_9663_cov_30.524258_3_plen_65_part_00